MGRKKMTARKSTGGAKPSRREEVEAMERAENEPDGDEAAEEAPAPAPAATAPVTAPVATVPSTPSPSPAPPATTTTPARMARSESSVIRSFGKATIATPTDVCFTFDTTGSMYASLTTVRDTIEKTAKNLVESLPQLRIAIIAHGDYVDDSGTYTTKILDFSRDVKEIVKFVHDVPSTGGGDAPEAYEKALYDANNLSWNPKATKAVVMFGDDVPHPPSYTTEKYSWRKEVDKLIQKDAKIYGIFCGSNSDNKMFYEEMADLTGGVFVALTEFSVVDKMFMAICYREVSHEALAAYEKEVKSAGSEDAGVRRMFRNLSDQNLAKKIDTGRVLAVAWWNDEMDEKMNAGALPNFQLNDATPPKFVAYGSGGGSSAKAKKAKKTKPKKAKKVVDSGSGGASADDDVSTTPKKGTKRKAAASKKGSKKKATPKKKTTKKTTKKKTTKSSKKKTSKKATKKKKSTRSSKKDTDADYEDEGDEDDEDADDEEEEEEEEEAPKKKAKKATKKKKTSSKKKIQSSKKRREETHRRRYRPHVKLDWEHPYSTPEVPDWLLLGKYASARAKSRAKLAKSSTK